LKGIDVPNLIIALLRDLDKIEKIWKTYPDQRFGQLLSNYIIDQSYLLPRTFFIEDEEFFNMEKHKFRKI
jgi:hypothetical protein